MGVGKLGLIVILVVLGGRCIGLGCGCWVDVVWLGVLSRVGIWVVVRLRVWGRVWWGSVGWLG